VSLLRQVAAVLSGLMLTACVSPSLSPHWNSPDSVPDRTNNDAIVVLKMPNFESSSSSLPMTREMPSVEICQRYSAALTACENRLRSMQRKPGYDNRYLACMKDDYGFESDPPECVH
jgi:hypothetical protein